MKISVIIPVLNESKYIEACLDNLQPLRHAGHQVIVVDGGSTDDTVDLARPLSDMVIRSSKGRARQMNAGAAVTHCKILLFLHADSIPGCEIDKVLADVVKNELAWGRFDVHLSGRQLLLRVVEFFMNLRSRLTGIATGDQAIFVTRKLYDNAGGIPEIELMEDIAFSSQLKKHCKPICLKDRVVSSSRRWEQKGIIATVLKMWLLRLKYSLGVNPAALALEYDGE